MRSVTVRLLPRSALVALVMAVGITTIAAAAIAWGPAIDLRRYSGTRDVPGHDADFAGTRVAVVWDERNPAAAPGPTELVFLRKSRDSGATFRVKEAIADGTDAEVEICGAYAWVVSANNWSVDTIVVWGSPLAGGPAETQAVSSGGAHAKWPDVACAGGRIFVSWVESGHLLVRHALRSDLVFSAVQDLGPVAEDPSWNGDPVMAGVGDHAYVAYERPAGDIELHRWTVGAGPGFAVTDLGASVEVADGSTDFRASKPAIGAQGDEVVVAWQKDCDVLARHSGDNGATWGPTATLFDRPCPGLTPTREFPRSVAIKDTTTIVSHGASGEARPALDLDRRSRHRGDVGNPPVGQ